MATSADYMSFVCEQLRGLGAVRCKKMFGEYMVYVNDRPVLLVCDNTVFVKKLEQIADTMRDAGVGYPYEGAKEHYILDIENREQTAVVVSMLERVSLLPKPGKKCREAKQNSK